MPSAPAAFLATLRHTGSTGGKHRESNVWLRLILGVACAVGATLLAGCAHYRLGTGSAPAFRTLFVEPVVNKTLLPQAEAVVSARIRESFLRDPRVTLAPSAAAADAVLVVVINDYHREVAAGRQDDTGLARKFNVTLGAACTLRDNRSGQSIFEGRQIVAVREVFTDSGQLQAEYQTLPVLAEVLAGKIAHAALDTW